jgi:HD-like signal output (HDOD) protein
MSSLDSFFASLKLPSMSEVAHALIRSLNRESTSIAEVRDVIAKDPALTASLLKLANSAQFGLPRGVSTLDDAIAMVGMARVRTLALSACMAGAFPTMAGLDRKAFWQSSMTCAGYSQWLAGGLEIDPQVAWLTGMMLRLGELLIAQAEPRSLTSIEARPSAPGERWTREKRLVGFSEGHITAELARRWNFPMQMVQALQRASEPLLEQAFSRLGAVIHLAGLLADTPNASVQSVDALPVEVLDALRLDVDWMRQTFPGNNSFIELAVA